MPHSQGNFYANLAYAQLQGEFGSNVGIVQVATPTLSNFSGGPWTTFADDLVIAAIRALVGTAPPNILTPGIGQPPNVTRGVTVLLKLTCGWGRVEARSTRTSSASVLLYNIQHRALRVERLLSL